LEPPLNIHCIRKISLEDLIVAHKTIKSEKIKPNSGKIEDYFSKKGNEASE